MIWSKQKQLAESLLADALIGRVHYFRTRYGAGVSHVMNRGWVTLDQAEILSCSTIKSLVSAHNITGDWYGYGDEVRESLHQKGIFTLEDFNEGITAVIGQDFDKVLFSDHVLTRAFSLLDKRLGKRRLKGYLLSDKEHEIVKRFFLIRYKAEFPDFIGSESKSESNI